MASASLVQVIDLTDSPPHIDTALRNYPDYDTKTTATQTSRKRRNGETGRTRALVESRDSSAEEENAKPEEVIEIPQAEGSKGGNGESTKKRSRRSKKSKDKGKDLVSSSLEDTQQDLPPTLEHDQLFFVDTTPAAIPAGMVFDSRGADTTPQSPSLSRAPDADKTPALLLPAHVSVLGAVNGEPIQIVQPVDSDSDTESYIEYLDYDDRLVRMSHSLLRFIAHCMQTAGTVRYFETPADEQKQSRFVCKRCGAESEHRTRECPIMIVRGYFLRIGV